MANIRNLGVARLPLGIAALLVGAGAMYRPAAKTELVTAPPVRSSPAPAVEDSGGPLRAICDYYGGSQSARACNPALPAFSVLLAAVPNPEKTHLALYLDRVVQSLLGAAQDEGYSIATFWLPWDADAQKLEPDSDKRERQLQLRRVNEPYPGMLYFIPDRNAAKPPAMPLAIFLISETPTSGINKTAFRRALSYLDDPGLHLTPLRHRGDQSTPAPIAYLGPFFSGSLPSLADLTGPSTPFEVISGSVTRHSLARTIFAAGSNVRFSSMVEDDDLAAGAFFRYIGDHLARGKVAILSESGTAYGAVLDEGKRKARSALEVISIRYPREISRVRNAYKDPTTLGPTGKDSAPVQQGLPLVLRDDEAGRDSVPEFSAQQSPVSQEAVLLGIAETLRREHVKYAGLVATDVLDLLFLSRFLRIACPDVRLFLFDSDLLFIRGLESAPFQGMLTVSTYPLFSQNQLWTQDQRHGPPRRLLFPSAAAEGVYNAGRAFFGPAVPANPPPCHAGGNSGEPFLEYAPPQGGTRPPLWLDVIGRDGFWPVANLDKGGAASSLRSSWCDDRHASGIVTESPSHLWTFVAVLLATVSLTHLWLLFGANCGAVRDYLERRRMPFDWVEYYWTAFDKDSEVARAVYLTIASLTLFTMLGLMAIGPAHLLWTLPEGQSSFQGWNPAWFLTGSGFLMALLFLAAAWLTTRGSQSMSVGLGRIVLVLAFPAFLWSFDRLFWGAGNAGYFLAYRALHLTDGVNPIPPVFLLFMGFCYLTWIHLRRQRLNAISAPKIPPIDLACGICVVRICAILSHRSSAWRRFLPLVLLCLWAIVFRPWAAIQTFENRRFDLLFALLVTLFLGCLLLVWSDFIYIWMHLKRMLAFLERHPLRHAFSRVPKEYSWLPIWQTNGLALNYVALARTRDALSSLRGANPPSSVAEIRASIETLQADEAFERPLDSVCYARMQASLYQEIEMAVESAEPRWNRGASESFDRELEDHRLLTRADFNEHEILEDEFIAVRCLAFIRWVLSQMRNLLEFVTTGFILMVLALNAYPFAAHRVLNTSVILAFVVLGTGVVLVFMQMERDALLSRIGETDANKLNKGFFFRLISFGTLPLLTVLASQFPSISGFLFSWVRPTLEALK